jgi:hypothetical protein
MFLECVAWYRNEEEMTIYTLIIVAFVLFINWGAYLNEQESRREREKREWRDYPHLYIRG